MLINRWIWITFQKAGIHCYPEAQTAPDLADVSFLGSPHRHLFKWRVAIEVEHNNRDIEFLQFQKWIEGLYSAGFLKLDHKSCEMIAEELGTEIQLRYPNRRLKIEISEDGENGCTLEFN